MDSSRPLDGTCPGHPSFITSFTSLFCISANNQHEPDPDRTAAEAKLVDQRLADTRTTRCRPCRSGERGGCRGRRRGWDWEWGAEDETQEGGRRTLGVEGKPQTAREGVDGTRGGLKTFAILSDSL